MFQLFDKVNVTIPVNGERIPVPGIAASDEYEGFRLNRNGAQVPATFVDVITYHDISVEQSKDGRAKQYYKLQKQSAFFTKPRDNEVPELDKFEPQELLAKVRESADTAPISAGANRAQPRRLTETGITAAV